MPGFECGINSVTAVVHDFHASIYLLLPVLNQADLTRLKLFVNIFEVLGSWLSIQAVGISVDYIEAPVSYLLSNPLDLLLTHVGNSTSDFNNEERTKVIACFAVESVHKHL